MRDDITQHAGPEYSPDSSHKTSPRAGSGPSPVSGLLLSVPEAGKFLGLTTWQVRGLLADRKLPVVQVGRKFFLRRAALMKWAESAEKWKR